LIASNVQPAKTSARAAKSLLFISLSIQVRSQELASRRGKAASVMQPFIW